jgi:hypothetical protein
MYMGERIDKRARIEYQLGELQKCLVMVSLSYGKLTEYLHNIT